MQSKSIALDKHLVIYKDLGKIDYQSAWDYQEKLLQENVQVKSILLNRKKAMAENAATVQGLGALATEFVNENLDTQHYFLMCEHPPVYTLGKSGSMDNVLINDEQLAAKGIEFYKTNRGGDITFHGPGQIVGYPVLDLEKYYTDIGRYLRELEEVIILTLAEYGIKGERSKGETGVWIDTDKPGRERKICAMGLRCSRWITMHGFALNVNTDLQYFNHIIPCGIQNKQVTSIEKELQQPILMQDVKDKIASNFAKVFNAIYQQ